jgi:hypothetical protein
VLCCPLAATRALLVEQEVDDEFLANVYWPRFGRSDTQAEGLQKCLEQIHVNLKTADWEWVPKLATIVRAKFNLR